MDLAAPAVIVAQKDSKNVNELSGGRRFSQHCHNTQRNTLIPNKLIWETGLCKGASGCPDIQDHLMFSLRRSENSESHVQKTNTALRCNTAVSSEIDENKS